ncbi:MAG: response regulator [Bacteroidetes bacterium]|nr:response regulator [Bacteroidota bacterium]
MVSTKNDISMHARSLIEASLDPLVTISIDGKIMDMNQATVDITGVSRELLKGTDFLNYFTEPEKASDVYQEVFAKGSAVNSQLTLRNKNGKLTDVLFNGSVYKDDKGKVLGIVIVARDVTVQKRIDSELLEAKEFAENATLRAENATLKAENATRKAEAAMRLAEAALEAKQQFLSNMSHEIRTPMNAIIGFTKVMLKTELTAKQKEYLMAIKVSGNALIVLIDDILDLAKVDAGKMTFEKAPFKLASSISAMLHLFELKIQEKNLALITEYDKNIPKVLVGDSVRLHQIILNLVSNAVKFTSVGKIIVKIELEEQDHETVQIRFSVQDTGIGISEDKFNSIFDNFQQASSDTSRLYGGTGLGLAIVKKLLEAQGSKINLKSELGKGTTFCFLLSFDKTNLKADLDIGLFELNEEIKSVKVLVVEDIPLNQLLMKTLLDDFGFERDLASNGKIAIEKLESNSYDIILMDLQMPQMNGFEATDYIRNVMHSKIPIIALTADVTTVDLAKCKAVGMNDYIAKPVDEKILYNKIVSLLTNPNQVKSENNIFNIEKRKFTDLTYLYQLTKSNRELIMEMISLYLEQINPLISTMKEGLKNKDWESIESAAHKLIPSFFIVGMHKDYENMAKKIQEDSKIEKDSTELHELIFNLGAACSQACKELKEEYTKLKNTL